MYNYSSDLSGLTSTFFEGSEDCDGDGDDIIFNTSCAPGIKKMTSHQKEKHLKEKYNFFKKSIANIQINTLWPREKNYLYGTTII